MLIGSTGVLVAKSYIKCLSLDSPQLFLGDSISGLWILSLVYRVGKEPKLHLFSK